MEKNCNYIAELKNITVKQLKKQKTKICWV